MVNFITHNAQVPIQGITNFHASRLNHNERALYSHALRIRIRIRAKQMVLTHKLTDEHINVYMCCRYTSFTRLTESEIENVPARRTHAHTPARQPDDDVQTVSDIVHPGPGYDDTIHLMHGNTLSHPSDLPVCVRPHNPTNTHSS